MPGVDDRYIESLEVARIPRRNRGTPCLRNAGDQRISQVDDATGPLALGSELSRAFGRRQLTVSLRVLPLAPFAVITDINDARRAGQPHERVLRRQPRFTSLRLPLRRDLNLLQRLDV
jgi:hypothetical protein